MTPMEKYTFAIAAIAAMVFMPNQAQAQKNGAAPVDPIEALIAKETDPEEIKALREIQEMNRRAAKKNAEDQIRAKSEAESAKKARDDAWENKCGKYRYAIVGRPIQEANDIASCKGWGMLKDSSTTTSASRITTFHHYHGATVMFVNGKISSYTEK